MDVPRLGSDTRDPILPKHKFRTVETTNQDPGIRSRNWKVVKSKVYALCRSRCERLVSGTQSCEVTLRVRWDTLYTLIVGVDCLLPRSASYTNRKQVSVSRPEWGVWTETSSVTDDVLLPSTSTPTRVCRGREMYTHECEGKKEKTRRE